MIYSRASATHSIPAIDAAAPDARFIYDAIDAAKSLLSTFNTFMEPEMARYMPSSYYLYIIYSAVFLYVPPAPFHKTKINGRIKKEDRRN